VRTYFRTWQTAERDDEETALASILKTNARNPTVTKSGSLWMHRTDEPALTTRHNDDQFCS
jgi:hypothetical protein